MPTLFYRDPEDGKFYPVVGGGNDHGNLIGLSDNDHPQYQLAAQKGAASGFASLDESAKVPLIQIPTGTTTVDVALGNHNHAADGYRKIWASMAAPSVSDGSNGDVWMTYV